MNYPRTLRMFALVPLFFGLAANPALAKDTQMNKQPPITKQTKTQLVRLLDSEFAWVRKPFPLGEQGLFIAPDGNVMPGDADLKMLVESKGMAAKPGDRVQITNVVFKGREIVLEINGGGKRKTKWYQHVQVGLGGTVAQAPQPTDAPKGTYLAIEFKDYVPEVTLEDLKSKMAPVFDFSVKSAAQAYVDTLPSAVRTAIGEHRVLVGMNKEMVTSALGRPPQRLRDKDDQDRPYEEWIFGEPPDDVQFIRFTGEEVTQVKIMKVDGQKIVRTQREVTLDDPAVATAQPKPVVPPRPTNAPTLRRPGEEDPAIDTNGAQTRSPGQPTGTNGPPKSYVLMPPSR